MHILQSKGNSRTFPFKLCRIWQRERERAKPEKLVKELYNNKKIGKSHIDLDDLSGEGNLPIQESIIIRKSAEEFLLSTQREIT